MRWELTKLQNSQPESAVRVTSNITLQSARIYYQLVRVKYDNSFTSRTSVDSNVFWIDLS